MKWHRHLYICQPVSLQIKASNKTSKNRAATKLHQIKEVKQTSEIE